MYIHLVPITWARDFFAWIPWNLTLNQRHFHWLFSSFSMSSSSKMDDIELKNATLPEFYGLRLKIRWYFEGELPDGSALSKNCLINDENNYWKVTFSEEYLSKTSEFQQKEKFSMKTNYRYISLSWFIYIYIYKCAVTISKFSYPIISLYK